MRSYLGPGEFFRKMKKKPAQQAVLDNLDNLSEQEINQLTGPHFPRWIKDQLIELKSRNGVTAADMATRIADMMNKASKVKE